MKFNTAYNRQEFIKFLQTNFLPEDFIPTEESVTFLSKMKYSSKAVKLGSSETLDLVVYEITHTSSNDARVALSKEAFRMLADEMEDRALVVFVSEDNCDNYRFSFIEISLDIDENSGHISHNYSNPHRYSYFLGKDIAYYTPNKYLNDKGHVVNVEDLRSRFSVEVLTKEFYNELSDWYAWAIKIIRFPNNLKDKTDDAKYNNESAIRLITRLIFVWFLKQRHLIPDEFFDENYIAQNLIDRFNPNVKVDLFSKSTESKYYKAILQNLFFAMLNSPITAESGKELSERHFRNNRGDYDNNKLMRYEDYFINPQLFVNLANNTVPFLNGGLFDCLDDKDKGMYYDGFSDREIVRKSLIVPDFLFFGEEVGKNIDLSEWYGDNNKKKVSARGIIDILKRYNFTVEENTPFDQEVSLDPELLGKVFENLLASFNPETQTTARKQTGSFYTPREIVQYIVNESLIAHLKRTVSEDLEPKFRQLLQFTDDPVDFIDVQRTSILQSLYDCKILDPACGSGAFPMGVLQQMVHILRRIDPDNAQWKNMLMKQAIDETTEAFKSVTKEERQEQIDDIERSFDEGINRPDYARKLYLIENCIYGVDIQPIAIQISKLRFFISLVVDQKTNTDPTDNFGIRPLPNLEAKFVAANTLIGLEKKEATLFDSEVIKTKEKELKIAKHKIFSAKTVRTKRKHRQMVNDLRLDIANMLKNCGAIGNAEARQLASWDMFDQNATSPFFDPEWMFGVKEGFDIVIGNPPYIQLQNNGGALGEMYQNCGFETFARTGDIYSLFYERGWQLLKSNAHLCFITSNKWMRAGYGESTRRFFAEKTNPVQLIDFAGVRIFESATVDTNILLFQKAKNNKTTLACTAKDAECRNNLSDYVQQNATTSSFNTNDSWVILSPIEQSIKRKIEAVGTPLKDWDIQINYGIKTGCNEAFIISGAKKDELIKADPKSAEIIRPILRGRDIKRYGYEFADLYLIATFPAKHYNIEDFPAVRDYLLSFGKERLEQTGKTYIVKGENIKARKKTNNKWFETQDSISYWEDFYKQKIIYPNMTKYLPFVFDDKKYLTNQKCFILTGNNITFLTAFLNSSLFKFCFRENFPELQGGTRELSKIFFDKISVLKVDNETEKRFEQAVTDIQKEYTKTKAINIDKMIFDLYNLTEEERETIGFLEIK